MKVTELHVAGQGAWPDLAVDRLTPELNVFYGPPRTGKSTVAQLAAQLLYGRTGSPWRRQFGQATPLAEGSLAVDAPQGEYVLRRRRDGSPHGRLMVAAASGAPVDSHTIRSLLSDVSPRLLSELYAVDFAEPPRAQVLLDGEFARQFTQAIAHDNQSPAYVPTAGEAVAPPLGDRRRIDELVRRRDDIVRQIEEQMSGQLRESASLEHELRQVDAALAKRRQALEKLQVRLRGAEAELAEIEARLRLFTLEASVRRGPAIDGDQHGRALARLDAEIVRSRQMLAELQTRQADVRRELAELQPDGTADSACLLADQRATVGVLERLLDDLDAEVAQLARALEPGRGVVADGHGRLSPVADMLRQQVYALCGQITEQERAVHREVLAAESRQLQRAQTDLGERLELLLRRRQSHVHEAELAARPVVMLAQPPVERHCQCQRHDEFIRRSGAMLLARTDRSRQEDDFRHRRLELERDRDSLRNGVDALDREIQELTARWQRLQHNRAQAGRLPLDELRLELDRLETEINRRTACATTLAPLELASPHRRVWKASDVLAQLTGGQLTQIRLNRDGGAAGVIDAAGRTLALDALTAAQQDQLYLALTLALTSSLSSRGVDLPLLLDEPFLRQDPAGAATMAGVLVEFCRDGRQAIVFTEDREAVRRFTSLGVEVRDIDLLRRGSAVQAPATLTDVEPVVRVVRQPVDAPPRALRLAGGPVAPRDEREVYYLSLAASLAEFPVLGRDTAAVFADLGILTVDDLLAADAADVARRLNRPAVSAATVRLWQSHMSLMCFVPSVSLVDAQVLAACDIGSPEALFTIDVPLLADAVSRLLASPRGRRFASSAERCSRQRLSELQKLARRQRDRWHEASGRYPWVERPSDAAPIAAQRTARPRRKPSGQTRRSTRCPSPSRYGSCSSPPVRSSRRLRSALRPPSAWPTWGSARWPICSTPTPNPRPRNSPSLKSPRPSSPGGRAKPAWRAASPSCETWAPGSWWPAASRSRSRSRASAPRTSSAACRALCRTAEGRRLLKNRKPPSRTRIAAWIRQAAHRRPLEAA